MSNSPIFAAEPVPEPNDQSEVNAYSNRTMTAKFAKIIPKEYVSIDVNIADGWAADFHIYSSNGVIGIDQYEEASYGTFKVEKGSSIRFSVENLTFSGSYIESATVDRINLYVNGTSKNYREAYSISFEANTDASISVNCRHNQPESEF